MQKRDDMLWDLIQQMDQEEGEALWQADLQRQEEAFLRSLTPQERKQYYLDRCEWLKLQRTVEVNRFRQGICWGVSLTGREQE